MKKCAASLTIAAFLACWLCSAQQMFAGSETNTISEYATLRWDGRDNTHVIYANGKVEFLGSKFRGVKKPDRADERSFFMNLAMNALAREGYELVAMTTDDYVFKRAVSH